MICGKSMLIIIEKYIVVDLKWVKTVSESRKRIAKDWEAVDFYDSDEDNFLDRTGDVEKKRQQRMAQSGKLDSIVETYETLVNNKLFGYTLVIENKFAHGYMVETVL